MVDKHQTGFYVIPANVSWTGLLEDTYGEPVYWRLPNITGDRVSYSVTVLLILYTLPK